MEFAKSQSKNNMEDQKDFFVAVIGKDQTEKSTQGNETRVRFCTWNLAGIRSNIRKGVFEFPNIKSNSNDSLQGIKCPEEKISAAANIPEYYCYFKPGTKKGYARMAIFSKYEPIAVHRGIGNEEFDEEVQRLALQFPQCYAVNTYVSTSGEQLVTILYIVFEVVQIIILVSSIELILLRGSKSMRNRGQARVIDRG